MRKNDFLGFERERLLIFAVFFCFSLFSGFAEVRKFSLSNGIPVFIKELKGNRIASLYFAFDGGVVYLEPQDSGLEDALMKMLVSGSKKYSYNENQDFFLRKTVRFFFGFLERRKRGFDGQHRQVFRPDIRPLCGRLFESRLRKKRI